MKTVINEKQRGLLFINGKFIKMLEPGRYSVNGRKKIETVFLDNALVSEYASLDILLKDEEIARQVQVVDVADGTAALHFVNGMYKDYYFKSNRYAFWTVNDKHTFIMADITNPKVGADIPDYIFSQLPPAFYMKVEVREFEKARVFFNCRLAEILDAGTYYFWRGPVKVSVDCVDTRLTQLDITGQEILTLDKVALRINFVCNYRIVDYVKVLTEIDDYVEQLHVAAQLALRSYVGKYRFDELLENKEQLSDYVFTVLKEKGKDLYVDIVNAGVKDIVLPGEIREIMNTVLVAEKRAQANVITRREEVASTRSLLNTAKLMDENKTLYKLKELEYIERICENVGSISVSSGSDILAQLGKVLGAEKGQ